MSRVVAAILCDLPMLVRTQELESNDSATLSVTVVSSAKIVIVLTALIFTSISWLSHWNPLGPNISLSSHQKVITCASRAKDTEFLKLLPIADSFEDHLDVEERKRLEHSLLRKLDRRMSILVLIYILNCTCLVLSSPLQFIPNIHQLSTGTMLRKYSGYEVLYI